MKFEFDLALIAIPIFALAIGYSLFRASSLGTRRSLPHYITALLRLLCLSLLSFAIARPYVLRETPADSLVALVDISSSVPDALGEMLLSRSRTLATTLGLPLKVIPFAKSSAPTTSPVTLGYTPLRAAWEKLNIGGTNLEKGIAVGVSQGGGSLLLLSDGYETEGSSSQSLTALANTRIYPIVTSLRTNDPQIDSGLLEISQLYAPLVAQNQKSVDVRTTISSSFSHSQVAQLAITHGDKSILNRQITIEPGKELVVLAASDPSAEGLNKITAQLSWRDAGGDHQTSRTIWLSGEKRDKILLLSGAPEDDRFLTQILKNQSYQLKSEVGEGRNGDIGKASDYRVIVLNNIPKSQLPPALVEGIPQFVRSGGGLIMIGGNRSFGLGGYIDSSIAEVLPVKLVPPRTEKKRLNVAVQLVIDKSRSMAEDNRLDFAKEAAQEVVRNLKDDDFIGVVGFDETPFIAQPIEQLARIRDQVMDRINRLFATRGTQLFPAMDEGRRGLMRVNAGRKHMIVLTDGKIPDPGDYYYELVRQMRPLGITISTVLVGNDADDGLLARIAELGGGSFYQTRDPRNLPKIFLSDVRVSTGERTLRESTDFSVRRGPDGLHSTTVEGFPTLAGFVECLRKEGALLELVVSSADSVSPLLASWSVGKGKSLAFTSDANGRWSANWMRWSEISEFWSDMVDAVRPKGVQNDKHFTFDLRSWIDRGELVLDFSLFEDPQGEPIRATLDMPDGSKRTIEFTAEGPGHYQARVAKPTAGKYLAQIRVGDTALPDVAWYLSGELFGEQPHERPNYQLLQEIADKTGGKINPSADDLKSFVKSTFSKESRSLMFLLFALLAFALEVMAREFLKSPRLWRKRSS